MWSELETERILLAAARVGQHVFAQQVLANCRSRCVFCGLQPSSFGATRMLLAGHIKPWKDSTPTERLDPCNGLAACPAHDVAFDTGMLTVNGGLRIHLARPLAEAIQTDPLARQYYGTPPLREVILLPQAPRPPPANTSTGTARRSSSNGRCTFRRVDLPTSPKPRPNMSYGMNTSCSGGSRLSARVKQLGHSIEYDISDQMHGEPVRGGTGARSPGWPGRAAGSSAGSTSLSACSLSTQKISVSPMPATWAGRCGSYGSIC